MKEICESNKGNWVELLDTEIKLNEQGYVDELYGEFSKLYATLNKTSMKILWIIKNEQGRYYGESNVMQFLEHANNEPNMTAITTFIERKLPLIRLVDFRKRISFTDESVTRGTKIDYRSLPNEEITKIVLMIQKIWRVGLVKARLASLRHNKQFKIVGSAILKDQSDTIFLRLRRDDEDYSVSGFYYDEESIKNPLNSVGVSKRLVNENRIHKDFFAKMFIIDTIRKTIDLSDYAEYKESILRHGEKGLSNKGYNLESLVKIQRFLKKKYFEQEFKMKLEIEKLKNIDTLIMKKFYIYMDKIIILGFYYVERKGKREDHKDRLIEIRFLKEKGKGVTQKLYQPLSLSEMYFYAKLMMEKVQFNGTFESGFFIIAQRLEEIIHKIKTLDIDENELGSSDVMINIKLAFMKELNSTFYKCNQRQSQICGVKEELTRAQIQKIQSLKAQSMFNARQITTEDENPSIEKIYNEKALVIQQIYKRYKMMNVLRTCVEKRFRREDTGPLRNFYKLDNEEAKGSSDRNVIATSGINTSEYGKLDLYLLFYPEIKLLVAEIVAPPSSSLSTQQVPIPVELLELTHLDEEFIAKHIDTLICKNICFENGLFFYRKKKEDSRKQVRDFSKVKGDTVFKNDLFSFGDTKKGSTGAEQKRQEMLSFSNETKNEYLEIGCLSLPMRDDSSWKFNIKLHPFNEELFFNGTSNDGSKKEVKISMRTVFKNYSEYSFDSIILRASEKALPISWPDQYKMESKLSRNILDETLLETAALKVQKFWQVHLEKEKFSYKIRSFKKSREIVISFLISDSKEIQTLKKS